MTAVKAAKAREEKGKTHMLLQHAGHRSHITIWELPLSAVLSECPKIL